jgi:hypothetical protein
VRTSGRLPLTCRASRRWPRPRRSPGYTRRLAGQADHTAQCARESARIGTAVSATPSLNSSKGCTRAPDSRMTRQTSDGPGLTPSRLRAFRLVRHEREEIGGHLGYLRAGHPAIAGGSVHHVQAVSSRVTPSPPSRCRAARRVDIGWARIGRDHLSRGQAVPAMLGHLTNDHEHAEVAAPGCPGSGRSGNSESSASPAETPQVGGAATDPRRIPTGWYRRPFAYPSMARAMLYALADTSQRVVLGSACGRAVSGFAVPFG